MKIAVIGAGSWGTALAKVFAQQDNTVSLWAYEKDVAETVLSSHENKRYLPGISLPKNITASCQISVVLEGARLVLFVVPSQHAGTIANQIAPLIKPTIPVISATKGIEIGSLSLMSEVIRKGLGREDANQIAVLSGPSFAQEVGLNHPTAVTIASDNHRLAMRLSRQIVTPLFKLLLSTDRIGVELGGALKNVIAIAAGISDGLGFGVNTKAILMTRGLSEIAHLGVAMGAQANTFYGLSGLGDLFLTCSGAISRNRKVGEEIGRGKSLSAILDKRQSVAEGVATTEAAYALSKKYKVRMPIIREVYQVLFQGKSPKEAVNDLMAEAYGKEILFPSPPNLPPNGGGIL
ncbi:MAG: NAD(P)H-dependent glycerol-3-phosphate dehydrogenase [Nitrospirota bacterium]